MLIECSLCVLIKENGSTMALIGSIQSNEQREMALFENLKTVCKAHLPIEKREEEALAFLVSANHEVWGNRCQEVIDALIKKINVLATENKEKAVCEISWELDQQIQAHFKAKMIRISAHDPERAPILNAICELVSTCKANNRQLHDNRQRVRIWGIPEDQLPDWYKKLSFDSKN